MDSLKNGAVDFVLKQRPGRLVSAVRRVISNIEESARLKKAQQALLRSEERLRIVAQTTNDVVWEWDVQNNQVWVGENFQSAYGHPTVSEMTSEVWFDYIHPDDKARVVSSLSTMQAEGKKMWWSEHRLRRSDGSYAYVFDRASVIRDSAGKVLSVVGINVDMTQRRQAEETIHEQAALLDKARDAIIVCNLNWVVLYWNRGAERIYGWKPVEAIGEDIRKLLFRDNTPPQVAESLNHLNDPGEWLMELQQFTKEGQVVVVQTRSTLIRDDQGQPKSLLIINTDITEQKQLEEQFLRTQRLESLGVLVSGIAHDLKNALVPITVGVDILQLEELSEDLRTIVQTMGASAQRSAEMIQQMLTFARGGDAIKSLAAPQQLIKEMGRVITDTFPKTIQFQMKIKGELPAIFCVATQIHQVLLNLCVNARDAMPQGGTLTLAAETVVVKPDLAERHPGSRPGNHVCIRVTDTGTGIPPEYLEKIFAPFFTTKPVGKGTGLGLSSCQNIVKSHAGFITVQSQLNVGTEFKVYLPTASAKLTTAPDALKAMLPIGKGERILLVDDEESVLAMARIALENFGYAVSTTTGGIEAIARFREEPEAFQLVITDYAMPCMDGKTLISSLRRIRPDMKIIMTSGLEKQTEISLPDFRADGFLAKPFTTDSLLTITYQILSK